MKKLGGKRPDGPQVPLSDINWQETGPRPKPGVNKARVLGLMTVAGVGGLVVTAGLLPNAAVGVAATSQVIDAWNLQSNTIPAEALPGRTTIVTGNGTKVAEVFTVNRVPANAEEQGETIREAVVSIEDARFFSHSGVDPVGTARAFVATSSGEAVQGGSTITQQYAKNLRLAQAVLDGGGEADPAALEAATERSWQRKVAEAHLAMLIEARMSKDDILTGYLNVAYFGAGAYGIEAAANRFFSVPANELTIPQAALLAGVLQSPATLDPRSNPEGAMQRRSQVLNAMANNGYITAEQAAAYVNEPIVLKTKLPDQGCAAAAAQWGMACDEALRELKTADWLEPQDKSLLRAGGMTVELTADPKTQKVLNRSAAELIPSDNRVANAATLIEPSTGYVKAVGSNRKFGNGKGATEIPLATTSAFSPASTFKLFTLVAVLEAGIPLSTILPAGSVHYSQVFDNPPGGYRNAEGLSASNVSIARATEMSINTAFVQLEERVGLDAIANAARRLGVNSIGLPGSKNYPAKQEGSFTLGVRDVSVTEMAGAYAAIANHGVYCKPTFVKSVTRPDGTVVKNPSSEECVQVVDPAVADSIAATLEGVVENGTGRSAQLGDRPAAGKTGTGEDAGSAWFAGFTPQLAGAVWTGDPRSPRYTLRNVMGYSTVYG
ncbi:MAG: transglycosylase domain-containing protein, partial [Actinobacteria bacterium]|nr:transglycosylase domain-containing protein [Actinomycetota bacterium]